MAEYRFRDTSLGVDERVEALLSELTLDEKLTLLNTRQEAVKRLGLKEFGIGSEVARGLVCRGEFGEAPTTVFPQPFGLAATFDPGVMSAMGEVTGVETRIYNEQGKASLCVWGPTVDAERDPRWGRNEEAYGEDPFLIGEMSAAYTRAMSGSDKGGYLRVIPTLKHFYANNNEQDRGTDNASIPVSLKHDYYLKAFEKAVRSGGAKSLMTAYNKINGVEGICNPEVDRICRREWGLLFAVTDGGDFVQNVQSHRSDKNHVESIARVYKNHGADIMTDDSKIVRKAAAEALEQGLITESDIDKALFGVLKARFLLGEFDKDCPYTGYPKNLVGCEEHYKAAERAAAESVILLKNNKGVLPLPKEQKLCVVGIHADMNFRDWYTGLSDKNGTILSSIISALGRENVCYDSGNDIIALRNARTGFYFSVSDDGTLVCEDALISESCLFELYEWGDGAVSLKSTFNGKFLADAGVMKCVSDEPYGWFVKEKFVMERRGSECLLRNWQNRFLYITEDKKLAVTTSLKAGLDSFLNIELFSCGAERVKRLASEAHNTVVFCGNNPQINARECTDRRDLELPEHQKQLLDAVLSINENAVMFLVSGFPYAINDKRISAILHTSHAGPAMGDAAAKVLFGDISPAGRCPVTWYKSDSELCSIKDYNIIRTKSTYMYYDGEPLFPFGHGLGYTTFRYGAVRTDKLSYESGERCEVTFELENVGGRSSDEVAQLYIVPPKMPRPLPIKQLKAFKRVFVPRGKKVVVSLAFDIDDLAFWNINTDSFEVCGGEYQILVGASSQDIRRSAEIHVNAPEYLGIDVTKPVPAAASCAYVGAEFDSDKKLNEYVQINDWQSIVSYEGCILRGSRKAEIVVSNPGSAARLTISCAENGKRAAEFEVPPTGSFDEFITLTADAEPVSGVFTLNVTAGGMLCLKSFRFF